MNIIFVSDRLGSGKNITLGHRYAVMLLLGWMLLPVSIAIGLYYFMLSQGGIPSSQYRAQNRVYLQENLNAMAARLGQLQAHASRLDALVDFMAEVGSPIKAAAGGVVVYSDNHPQYGNMIAIDHGNGLISRYAHASKRLVGVDNIVLQGRKIGEVGGTGRSTGPHLHFEILSNGTPQNPARYLQVPG